MRHGKLAEAAEGHQGALALGGRHWACDLFLLLLEMRRIEEIGDVCVDGTELDVFDVFSANG